MLNGSKIQMLGMLAVINIPLSLKMEKSIWYHNRFILLVYHIIYW